ncbi:hypothetical protein C1645_760184, partial [Glomus cerebriforme]
IHQKDQLQNIYLKNLINSEDIQQMNLIKNNHILQNHHLILNIYSIYYKSSSCLYK